MPWPTGPEYSDAVQNPRQAFEDSELQGGRIETDRLGLPRPRSGNFSVVYKIDCTGRSWAVKCFTREVADQQKRYAEISAHLRRLTIPYIVGFDYLTRGVRIRGQWFPALKMEWVSGDPLIRFIDSHLRDPVSIRALASRWVAMLKALRTAGIAHGDLQHGNVLVVGEDLKLVDYDGMFVPALSGAPAIEAGHPNYQHPGRANLPFGPDLDNFSAWSIYVSLIALSIDPSLWSRLKAGDDCLLFRAGDLAVPDSSQTLKTLAASPDEGLRSLIELFAELLRLKAEQIPPLHAPKIRIGSPSTLAPSRTAGWLDDYVKPTRATALKEVSPVPPDESEVIDASWVLDFITPASVPEDARFVHSVLWLRLSLVSAALLALVAFLILPGSGLSAVIVAILVSTNIALITARYRIEPGLASMESARAVLSEIDGRFRAAAAQAAELETERRRRATQRDRDVAVVEARIRGTHERATREVHGVKRRLDAECAETQKRRRQVDAEEHRALGAVANSTGARAANLRNQLQALAQEEASESANALTDLQGAHLQNALSSATIAGAHIQGVGPQLKAALVANGITSAQDVDRWRVHRISGFGPARVSAVLAWRAGIEQRARGRMPQALSASQAQVLRAKYAGRRQTLGEELQRVEAQQRSEERSIKARFAAMRQELDNLEAAPKATATREIQAMQENCNKAVSALKGEEDRVVEVAKADLAALDTKVAELRRTSLSLQWEKARAAARVEAYAPVTFTRYLEYVALGAGKVG